MLDPRWRTELEKGRDGHSLHIGLSMEVSAKTHEEDSSRKLGGSDIHIK